MSFEIYACIAAVGVMVMSLSGVLFTTKLTRQFLEERLPYLVSFSAGVFLVSAFLLALEVFELSESLLIGAVLIMVGYLLAWGVQRFLPETHHHHDEHCSRERRGVRSLIIGDGIHNIADGVVIVSAFAVSSTVGVVATISIMIHEALQEVAEYFVLRRAGYTARQALLINFAVSATILLGVLLGSLALVVHDLEVFLLALAAGFFLQVVIHDLLPRRDQVESKQSFINHLLIVIGGLLLMGSVNLLLGESHSHENEHGAAGEEAEHVHGTEEHTH